MTLVLQMSLALTGWFLKEGPIPQGENLTINTCTISCFLSRSCAGFFYDVSDGMCYKNTLAYTIDEYQTLLDDKNHESFQYYEWSLDICSQDGWHYHRQTKTCFKYVEEKLTRGLAEDGCRARNSTLISLDGRDKMDYFRNFANMKKKKIWTSGRRINETWIWGNGINIGNTTNWKNTREYPKDDKLDCILVHEDGNGWEPKECTSDVDAHVCERNLASVPNYCPNVRRGRFSKN